MAIEEKVEELKLLAKEFAEHGTRLSSLGRRVNASLAADQSEASKAVQSIYAEFTETLFPMMVSLVTTVTTLVEEAVQDEEPEVIIGIEPEDAAVITEVFNLFKQMLVGTYENPETPVEIKNGVAKMMAKEAEARALVESLVLDDDDEEGDEIDDDGDADDEDED